MYKGEKISLAKNNKLANGIFTLQVQQGNPYQMLDIEEE